MEWLSSSPPGNILQMMLFCCLGLLCLDAQQGYPLCPDGCTCKPDNTVVCNGLELTVVEVPDDTTREPLRSSLRDNQINRLSSRTFERLVQQETLTGKDIQSLGSEVIHGEWRQRDMLHCDCRIAWMETHPSANHLTCESPAEYRGIHVPSALRHLDCPRIRVPRDGRFNFCDSDPCANGATCTHDSSGYRCICRLGYTGMHCDTWTTLTPPLEVELSNITPDSMKVTWWFPDAPIESFQVAYTSSTDSHMPPAPERTFSTDVRTWYIKQLQPDTKYTVCVTAKRDAPLNDVEKCEYAVTPSPSPPHRHKDKGPGHGSDHDGHDKDHDGTPHGPGWKNKSSPPPPPPRHHQKLMIVFGIAIALCFLAIGIVTVIYYKRFHTRRRHRRDDSISSTARPNSMDRNGNTFYRSRLNDIPTISVVDMSGVSGPSQGPPRTPPHAPPNTPTLPSYEAAVQDRSYYTNPFVNPPMGRQQGESIL